MKCEILVMIACRDYPHPRHLCARFPFTSTPHDRHCHLCHCYVCDALAPCVQWGTATSSIDHCHATDKLEYWKLRRRNLKKGDIAPPPVPKLPDTSAQSCALQKIPPPPPLPLPSLRQPEYVAHHPVSRPTTIRACSTSTNSIIPKGRIQQPSFVSARNKCSPHLVSQQPPITPSDLVRRDRNHLIGNIRSHFTNSHAVFKRTGSAGVRSTNYRSRYTSSNNNHATQYFRNSSPIAASNNKYHSTYRDSSSTITSDTTARQAPFVQSTDTTFGSSMPSHDQMSSHPNRQVIDSVPSQPVVVSSNLNIGSSIVGTVPYPPASSSQPNMEINFEYSAPLQPHGISQLNIGSSFTSPEPSQHQVYSQPIPEPDDSHNGAQNPPDPCLQDFNATWVDPTDLINQQPFTDISHYQSSVVTEFSPQIPMNTGSPDFHYDSWMLENHPISEALEDPVPSEYVYSPEPSHVDSDFFFDF